MNICDTILSEKKNINYNSLVHALTNRKKGFSSYIPDGTWFYPLDQDDTWYELQSGLFLDKTNTDYYIFLAISLLQAHENVINRYEHRGLTFSVDNIRSFQSSMQDGNFTTVGRRMGRFTNYKDLFPVPGEYDIRYHQSKSVKVTTDVGRFFICDSHSSVRDLNSILTVEWDERLPFRGPMVFYGGWNETSNITINYVPFGIDYKSWIEYIETKMDILKILNKTNLFSQYSVSGSYSEKLALLLVSLALLNTSVNGKR